MTCADDYPIVIRRNGGGYIAEAAALGLKRAGPDVNVLEADIRAAVGEILAVCDRHDARIEGSQQKDVAIPGHSPYRRSIAGAAIAVLTIVIVTLPLMWGFQKISGLMSTSLEQISAAQFEKLLTTGVQKTASSLEAITPQRRDQLANDFGRIARALEPYASQLRPLLVSSAPSDAQIPRDSKRP